MLQNIRLTERVIIKCDKCGNKLGFFEDDFLVYPENIYQKPNRYCKKCYEIERKRIEEEINANAPKVKCPYCDQWFLKVTEEQYRYSLEGNIARGLIFLPWGVVRALQNKPYIECPHCKMKIMQG